MPIRASCVCLAIPPVLAGLLLLLAVAGHSGKLPRTWPGANAQSKAAVSPCLAEAPGSQRTWRDEGLQIVRKTADEAFLKAVRAEVRNGTIWVWLKNSGSGALKQEDYRQGALEVQVSSARKTIPLGLVDPEQRLAAPEGIVCFDTGFSLRGPARIVFNFQRVPGAGPRAFSLRPAPVLGIDQEGLSTDSRQGPPAPQPPTPSTQRKISRTRSAPPGPEGSFRASGTVKVFLTSRGSRFSAGQHLQLGWQFNCQPQPNVPFSIRLVSTEPEGFSREITASRPKRPHFLWRIPSDVPAGQYRLSVGAGPRSDAGSRHSCSGFSRRFTIVGQ